MPSTLFTAAALAAAAVASFAAGRAWTLRRARPPSLPFTPEDCAAAADLALSQERWGDAIAWLQRLRRLAPTSARACVDLAFAHAQAGDADEALRLYEEAVRLSPSDADVCFHGARTALAAGRGPAEAEAWLARALALDPGMVADAEEDDAFEPLRNRPRFKALLQGAWRTLGSASH